MAHKTRHNRGWLKHVFATVAAVSLTAGAASAFAGDDISTPSDPLLDAGKIPEIASKTRKATMPELLARACSGADVVLIGDTDHTSLPVWKSILANETLDAMVACGVTSFSIELSADFQPTLDKFMSGAITQSDLATEYEKLVSNFHNMPEADYREKNALTIQMITHARDIGLKVDAVDPQNGAGAGFITGVLVQGAFNRIRDRLPEEFRPYQDFFLAGEDGKIPDEHRKAFEEAFIAEYQRPDIQKIFAKVDEYKAAFEAERKNDTTLADAVTDGFEQGRDKTVLMYGVAHMSNDRPDGIDALLKARGLKVARVDVFENRLAVEYQPGEDLPQHVFLADSQTAFTLNTSPAGAPGPLVKRIKKAEM